MFRSGCKQDDGDARVTYMCPLWCHKRFQSCSVLSNSSTVRDGLVVYMGSLLMLPAYFSALKKICIRVNHFISTFTQPLTSWRCHLKQELKWIKHCYEPKLEVCIGVLWLPPGVVKSHARTCLSNWTPINLLKPRLDIVNCRVTAGGAVCRAVLGHSQCRARPWWWSDPKIKDSVFVLTRLATLCCWTRTHKGHTQSELHTED